MMIETIIKCQLMIGYLHTSAITTRAIITVGIPSTAIVTVGIRSTAIIHTATLTSTITIIPTIGTIGLKELPEKRILTAESHKHAVMPQFT